MRATGSKNGSVTKNVCLLRIRLKKDYNDVAETYFTTFIISTDNNPRNVKKLEDLYWAFIEDWTPKAFTAYKLREAHMNWILGGRDGDEPPLPQGDKDEKVFPTFATFRFHWYRKLKD